MNSRRNGIASQRGKPGGLQSLIGSYSMPCAESSRRRCRSASGAGLSFALVSSPGLLLRVEERRPDARPQAGPVRHVVERQRRTAARARLQRPIELRRARVLRARARRRASRSAGTSSRRRLPRRRGRGVVAAPACTPRAARRAARRRKRSPNARIESGAARRRPSLERLAPTRRRSS